jgi:hypothetical protein
MLSSGIEPTARVFDDTSIKMGSLLGTEENIRGSWRATGGTG